MKTPFVTKAQLDEIVQRFPTPFHIYDEAGIRENARHLNRAFSWNPGFKEYFAVKATPNPAILQILREEGCGADCSSLTELMLADRVGFSGDEIMFSSNATPAEEFQLAAELGATINLDDITHIPFLERAIGYIPEKICCRYNPGGEFIVANAIMDQPGEAKYGMTREQMTEAYRTLRDKGAKEFGIHSFLASNTLSDEYYPTLAAALFRLAVELHQETGNPHRFRQPLRRHRHSLPAGAARQQHRDHRRGRSPRLRGDSDSRGNGRRGNLHRAWPVHAGSLRTSGRHGDSRKAHPQGIYRSRRLCL